MLDGRTELHRLDYLIYPENRWGATTFVSDDTLIADLIYSSGFPAVAPPNRSWRSSFSHDLFLYGKNHLWILCETSATCVALKDAIQRTVSPFDFGFTLFPMPRILKMDYRMIAPTAIAMSVSSRVREQEERADKKGTVNLNNYKKRLEKASGRYD